MSHGFTHILKTSHFHPFHSSVALFVLNFVLLEGHVSKAVWNYVIQSEI